VKEPGPKRQTANPPGEGVLWKWGRGEHGPLALCQIQNLFGNLFL
jgi:hypothetical protein